MLARVLSISPLIAVACLGRVWPFRTKAGRVLQKNFRYGNKISLRRFVLASHEIVLRYCSRQNQFIRFGQMVICLAGGNCLSFLRTAHMNLTSFWLRRRIQNGGFLSFCTPWIIYFRWAGCTIIYSVRTLIPIYLVLVYFVRSKRKDIPPLCRWLSDDLAVGKIAWKNSLCWWTMFESFSGRG